MTYFRNQSYSGLILPLSTTTTYHLSWTGSDWATTTTPEYIDETFLRSINAYDVFRDGSDQISTSGTYDPNIKKVTSTVSYWRGHSTTTRLMSTYITNIYEN